MNFPVLNKNGIQRAVYPTMVVNISQIPNGGYSHRGRLAVDEAGSDTGKDNFFAPFDAEIEYVELVKNKTGVQITNTTKVECADGTIAEPYELHEYTYHDDDISDCYVGRKLKQGEVYYQEGTAGNASGNHVHYNIGRGKYTKNTYPLMLNKQGTWEVYNEVDPTTIFFITNKHTVKRTKGMRWVKVTLDESKNDVNKDTLKNTEESPVDTADVAKTLRVGSVVKFKNPKSMSIAYTNGRAIHSWVRQKTHIVGQISSTRILLVESVANNKILKKGVYSWVYIKDIEVV